MKITKSDIAFRERIEKEKREDEQRRCKAIEYYQKQKLQRFIDSGTYY